MDRVYDLIIIGAGAAGLFCAAEFDGDCCILEKNGEAARKIYATGNGRCNFLNSEAEPSCYNNTDFVAKAMEIVCTDDLIYEFERFGIIAKDEEDGSGRLYPRSEEATSIAHALIKAARGAEIRYNFEVKSAEKKAGAFIVYSTEGEALRSRRLLIASGGKAGIQFGSDGRGYKLAEAFGHSIVKPVPALVPMLCEEDLTPIAGVRCEAMINLIRHSKDRDEILAFEYFGEVQFTKSAISGICVMDLSREIRLEEGLSYTLTVNPLWEYEPGERKKLLEDFPLEYLIPAKLAAYMPDGEPMSFNIIATKGWRDAQTSSGGVDVSEVDPQSMESKLVPGLYFAGELLDVDGCCGGYNLGWAFTSAMIAAEALSGI